MYYCAIWSIWTSITMKVRIFLLGWTLGCNIWVVACTCYCISRVQHSCVIVCSFQERGGTPPIYSRVTITHWQCMFIPNRVIGGEIFRCSGLHVLIGYYNILEHAVLEIRIHMHANPSPYVICEPEVDQGINCLWLNSPWITFQFLFVITHALLSCNDM